MQHSSSHTLVVHFASTHLQNHHGQEQYHHQQEPRQSRPVSHFVPVECLVVQVKNIEAGVIARPGDDTRFYVLYLYNQAFDWYEMGYGSALAWLLLVVVLLLTVVVLKVGGSKVHYEGMRG